METFMNIWNTVKGKVAVTILALLFGLSMVVTYTGLEVVDCPDTMKEGSLCLSPAEQVVEDVVTTTE